MNQSGKIQMICPLTVRKLFILGSWFSFRQSRKASRCQCETRPILLYTNSKLNVFSDVTDKLQIPLITFSKDAVSFALYRCGSQWLLWLPWLLNLSLHRSHRQLSQDGDTTSGVDHKGSLWQTLQYSYTPFTSATNKKDQVTSKWFRVLKEQPGIKEPVLFFF